MIRRTGETKKWRETHPQFVRKTPPDVRRLLENAF